MDGRTLFLRSKTTSENTNGAVSIQYDKKIIFVKKKIRKEHLHAV